MALQPRLDLRQTQALVMTPQLQQAIKLLQLSNLELSAYVEQELERNPLLERQDAPREPTYDGGPAEERRDAAETVVVDRAADTPAERAAGEAPLDVEVDNSYDGPAYDPDSGAWGQAGSGGRSDFSGDERGLEETLASEGSLRDHLIEQADLDIHEAGDRLIAYALIDSLDDNGWLTADLADLAALLGVAAERVAAVLVRCQRFDPPGLFCRSLKECLALQLADRNRLDPAMQALLDHLDLLARRDVAGLLKACGVDGEDLQEMIAEIKALDPKPAQRFAGTLAQPVVPDVLIRPSVEGGWIVELNPETLPRVLVNTRYYATVQRGAKSKEDKGFLSESFQTANWLVKSLDQRANTILKVATEIVRQQHGFFERGVSGLKPLILRDVSSAIDMHESTVSRVTSNKYIATPRGIFELKYFFTQAIAGADGADAHSAEAVRHRIKALIDAEPPKAILSDDAIVDILRKEGIDIARRTVAKYREGMKIPSSVQRRREKAMLAVGS